MHVVSALAGVLVIVVLVATTDRTFDVVMIGLVGVVVAVIAGLRSFAWWPSALDTFAWTVPVIAFAVTLVAVGGEAKGTLSFHEVSAQVIATLILALAIEAQVFKRPAATEESADVTALITVLLLCVGEFQALQSVFRKTPTDAEMVAGAIAAGLVGVIIVAVVGLKPRAAVDDAGPARTPPIAGEE
jgi:hypothetical protein